MRVGYLDCFAGVAGDMFLGALVHAGVPVQVLEDATDALGIDASLQVEIVDRSGIASTKVHVLESGKLAEGDATSRPATHTHIEQAEQEVRTVDPLQVQPKTQHLHKTGHPHTHEHEHGHVHSHDAGDQHAHSHAHGRSLQEIRRLIEAAALHPEVKRMALRTFELLGTSEARMHNVPVEQIHFHEVGAVDAIVDIVASCAGIHHLNLGAWHSSALNVGGGMVDCAHGHFPVPAPATADLLRGYPTYSAHIQKELVTPTGAALVRMLEPVFGPQPAMRVDNIGYGAGTRNPANFPNVLRLSVGELSDDGAKQPKLQDVQADAPAVAGDLVAVLETALDDASPQVLAYVAEQALAAGALDVMLTPVIMKKGRPGTLLTLLAHPENSSALEAFLLRETTSLGVRVRQERRTCLQRAHEKVETRFGPIRIKVGRSGDDVQNAAPEFEDCKAAAIRAGAPLKQVQQEALAAYLRGSEGA